MRKRKEPKDSDRTTGDSDMGTVGIEAIPRAVARRRANLEELSRTETSHTSHHHHLQLFQTLTLPAVKMAATAVGVAPTLAVTRLKELLPSASMRRIVEPMMRTRIIGLRRAGLPLDSPGPKMWEEKR